MSPKLISAALALGLGFAGPVFAQANSTVCNQTLGTMARSPGAATGPGSPTSMAATSSDSGNTATGASSASIGTGPVDKTGMNSPCVPGTSGQGATGALPNASP